MLTAKQIEQRTQRLFDESVEQTKEFWRRRFVERRERATEMLSNHSVETEPQPAQQRHTEPILQGDEVVTF